MKPTTVGSYFFENGLFLSSFSGLAYILPSEQIHKNKEQREQGGEKGKSGKKDEGKYFWVRFRLGHCREHQPNGSRINQVFYLLDPAAAGFHVGTVSSCSDSKTCTVKGIFHPKVEFFLLKLCIF